MKKHESGLCSLCKIRESNKHLLLACNKEKYLELVKKYMYDVVFLGVTLVRPIVVL